MKFITKYWYQSEIEPPVYLKILSSLFSRVSRKRRQIFLQNENPEYQSPVPVVVIGNISVGGTGKTPLLISLVSYLQQKKFKVGVISRGYGGNSKQWPIEVDAESSASIVGDEPLLIAIKTRCPMFVGPDRNDDIKALLNKYPDINVILSDDGMQHYKLQRDVEIAVIDSKRLFGNKKLLPAGPLREPVSRLKEVDILVYNGVPDDDRHIPEDNGSSVQFTMNYKVPYAYKLNDSTEKHKLSESSELSGLKAQKIHAVAGIGNPQRFFDMLTSQGLDIIAHAFDDHHQYKKSDLDFDPVSISGCQTKLPTIMTEKDAVKCKDFDLEDCWVVAIESELSNGFYEKVIDLLEHIQPRNNPSTKNG